MEQENRHGQERSYRFVYSPKALPHLVERNLNALDGSTYSAELMGCTHPRAANELMWHSSVAVDRSRTAVPSDRKAEADTCGHAAASEMFHLLAGIAAARGELSLTKLLKHTQAFDQRRLRSLNQRYINPPPCLPQGLFP